MFLLGALIALVAGFGTGYAVRGSQVPADSHLMSGGMMMQNGGMMGMREAMDGMMGELRGKTGDEFDKTFLSEMTLHHEGAVEMAEAALRYGKHAEIREMAQDIISAQTAEIERMRAWGESWYNQ